MNAFDNRAALTSAALLFLANAATSILLAEPLAFQDDDDGRRSGPDSEFGRRVETAADLIREQALRVPTCRAYFARLGVDLDAWLAPDVPPYVVARKLGFSLWRSTQPICGGAQSRPPFEVLFVDKGCFRGRRICELASLLLHELGHLARRDTRDNEPPEFFALCRLSSCVDPARFE